MQLITHDGKTYKPVECDGFLTYELVPTLAAKPEILWTGGRIPYDEWQRMVSFCIWSYDTSKSEAQLRLFYNPTTRQWKSWAFPQHYGLGLSAKEIADHPDAEAQRNAIGQGFEPWGTNHHHCSISAFQSGTDHADEHNANGIHITIGKLAETKLDIHVRVVLRGTTQVLTPSQYYQWFEPPTEWATLPFELLAQAVPLAMSRRSDVEFPAVWKTNLVQGHPVQPIQRYGSSHGANRYGSHYGHHNVAWSGSASERDTRTVQMDTFLRMTDAEQEVLMLVAETIYNSNSTWNSFKWLVDRVGTDFVDRYDEVETLLDQNSTSADLVVTPNVMTDDDITDPAAWGNQAVNQYLEQQGVDASGVEHSMHCVCHECVSRDMDAAIDDHLRNDWSK